MSNKVELPDIEYMFNLINEIEQKTKKKLYLELELKFEEAKILRKATSEKGYFIGGKPPSVSYVDSTWKQTGFEGELIPKREELATTIAELDTLKMKFYLHKDTIELYRTQSANERISLV